MTNPQAKMREQVAHAVLVKHYGPFGVKGELKDSIIQALADAETRGLERAAQWHDQRARDTPDAFEMEFHLASATAIRNGAKP